MSSFLILAAVAIGITIYFARKHNHKGNDNA